MSTVAAGQDWHPCHRPGMAAAHAPCWAKSTFSEDEAQLEVQKGFHLKISKCFMQFFNL